MCGLDAVIALNDIGQFSILLGNEPAEDCHAGIRDGLRLTFSVLEEKEFCLLSVHSGLIIGSFQAAEVFCFSRAHNSE